MASLSNFSLYSLRRQLPTLLPRIGILAGLLVAAFIVVNLAGNGTLNISTGSSDAAITVMSFPVQSGPQQGNIATTKTGTGQLSVQLRAGSYIVSVTKGDSQVNRLVTVGWLSNQQIALSPSATTATEPVLYESVQGLAADKSRMIYINNAFNGIEYLGAGNTDTQITGNQYFTSVTWVNTSYGVAQDQSGKLYVIDGTSAHALSTPVSGSGLKYAVAPNKTIYLGLDSHVYRGSDKSGFTQISSDFTSRDQLVAANDKVLIVDPGAPKQNGAATVVGTDGKTVHKNFAYPLAGWTPWSPDGGHVVVSIGGRPVVLDASLNQVDLIPQPFALNGGAWLDDNTLYYGISDQLWAHNLSQKTSTLVAQMPGQRQVQGVSVSTDNSYIYLTTSDARDSSGNYPRAVFRVGLRGQHVPSELSTLQDLMPINTSTYSIGLKNFSGPLRINVLTYPGIDPSGVQQAAKDTLQGIIDTSNVTFDVEAGD